MAATIPEEAMAEWSDGRLDKFAVRMDERFDRVDEKFGEVNQRIDLVDERLGSIQSSLGARIEHVGGRIDRVQETMVAGFISLALLIVTAVGVLVTLMVVLH